MWKIVRKLRLPAIVIIALKFLYYDLGLFDLEPGGGQELLSDIPRTKPLSPARNNDDQEVNRMPSNDHVMNQASRASSVKYGPPPAHANNVEHDANDYEQPPLDEYVNDGEPDADSDARRQKAKEQSEACWKQVDWGILRPMPTPKLGTRQCQHFDQPAAIDKSMPYCVFPSDTQIHTQGLKSKHGKLLPGETDGFKHDPRMFLKQKHISYECGPGKEDKPMSGPNFVKGNHFVDYDCGVPPKPCDLTFPDRTILLHRKDEHNPFFMLSLLLNVWMLEDKSIQVIFLGDSGVQPIDDLFQKVLSPKHPLLYAHEMIDKTWCFKEPLWIAPGEYAGPLMNHLNDNQECGGSQLVKDLLVDVHAAYPVPARSDDRTLVTFVGRKIYNNRKIERILTNEQEIIDTINTARPDMHVRLVYFEDLTFPEQIEVDMTTDIMVGMHGGGMVHVFFLPDHAQVVEIFPKIKRRWGYRNFCKYRGLRYDDYRGGKDGPLSSKKIDILEWMKYWNERFPPP